MTEGCENCRTYIEQAVDLAMDLAAVQARLSKVLATADRMAAWISEFEDNEVATAMCDAYRYAKGKP